MLGGRVVGGHQVLRLVADSPQCRRHTRNRLGRVGLLPGHRARRHRPLLDVEDRLAVLPVQDEEVAGLRRHGEGVDRLAAPLDLEQHRRRRRIVVPDVVVDRLEVPAVLAGPDVDRDHGVREEVGAVPVAAVGEGNRRGERQEHEFPFLVDREVERPGVPAQATPPALALPGLVADLARLRHGVELPQLLAGDGAERPGVADSARRAGGRVRADDDDVLPDQGHGVVGNADVDDAAIAELRRRRSRGRVERDETRAGAEQDAGRGPVRAAARPVRDAAARRGAVRHRVAPGFGPGRRVERDHRAGRRQVEQAVHRDGRRLGARRPPGIGRRTLAGGRRGECEAPGRLEVADVGGRDLGQRRVPGSRGVAAVHRPVGARRTAPGTAAAAQDGHRRDRRRQRPYDPRSTLHRCSSGSTRREGARL